MPAVDSPSSRWMSGIATLTMLLSRYVMKVARPTATSVHRFFCVMFPSPIRRTCMTYRKRCTTYSCQPLSCIVLPVPPRTATATATKSDLSRSAIVERALSVMDAEGPDAVTIRRIAQEFGVTPMALYWHVANKDELLAAMGDALLADVVPPPATGSWSTQL